MNRLRSTLETDMSAIEPPDAEPTDATMEEVCYRHTDRPSGVTCQRCDRTICPECMHNASVGVHCPECTKNAKQKVYTARTLPGSDPIVTKAIIAINVVVFLAFNGTGTGTDDLLVNGRVIDQFSEPWRVVTGGFAHAGALHLGMNMFALWNLGRMLERRLGPTIYAAAYMASLIGGSFLAILFDPSQSGLGASGAVFGLLGLIVLALRSRGIGLQQSGLGRVLLINLFISFLPFVSLWAHLGGFLVGLVLGAIYFGMNQGDGAILKGAKEQLAVTIGLGVLLFGAALWAASTWTNPIF